MDSLRLVQHLLIMCSLSFTSLSDLPTPSNPLFGFIELRYRSHLAEAVLVAKNRCVEAVHLQSLYLTAFLLYHSTITPQAFQIGVAKMIVSP